MNAQKQITVTDLSRPRTKYLCNSVSIFGHPIETPAHFEHDECRQETSQKLGGQRVRVEQYGELTIGAAFCKDCLMAYPETKDLLIEDNPADHSVNPNRLVFIRNKDNRGFDHKLFGKLILVKSIGKINSKRLGEYFDLSVDELEVYEKWKALPQKVTAQTSMNSPKTNSQLSDEAKMAYDEGDFVKAANLYEKAMYATRGRGLKFHYETMIDKCVAAEKNRKISL